MEQTHVRQWCVIGNYPGQLSQETAGCQKPQEAKAAPRGRHGHWSLSPSWGRCHRLQLLGLLVWEVWSLRQLCPPLAFSLFSNCHVQRRGRGQYPAIDWTFPTSSLAGRVTNITTRAVHDAAKCTQMFTGEEMYVGKVVWRVTITSTPGRKPEDMLVCF